MREALKYTLRLHDHIGGITKTHFELHSPFLSQTENDAQTYRAYLQEMITDRAHYSDLTVDQRYLHDLGGLVAPVLSVYRFRLRLAHLKRRTRDIRASARLEECCQHLALATYNFKERIKAFGESTIFIILGTHVQTETSQKIGKIIHRYAQANERVMRYRNFVVHGPKGRLDEFADLRSW